MRRKLVIANAVLMTAYLAAQAGWWMLSDRMERAFLGDLYFPFDFVLNIASPVGWTCIGLAGISLAASLPLPRKIASTAEVDAIK